MRERAKARTVLIAADGSFRARAFYFVYHHSSFRAGVSADQSRVRAAVCACREGDDASLLE